MSEHYGTKYVFVASFSKDSILVRFESDDGKHHATRHLEVAEVETLIEQLQGALAYCRGTASPAPGSTIAPADGSGVVSPAETQQSAPDAALEGSEPARLCDTCTGGDAAWVQGDAAICDTCYTRQQHGIWKPLPVQP